MAAKTIGRDEGRRVPAALRAEQMLADAMVTFNARVIPASTTPEQPGEVPAAATLGATGSYATEAAKLTAAFTRDSVHRAVHRTADMHRN